MRWIFEIPVSFCDHCLGAVLNAAVLNNVCCVLSVFIMERG